MDKPEKKELHGKESTEIDLIGHQYALETLVRNLGLKEGSNYSDILENVIPKSSVGEIVDVYERWNGIIYSIGQGRGTTDKSDYTWDMWKAIKTCAERCK